MEANDLIGCGRISPARVGANDSRLRIAHVLRKYNPAEWGGTETALQRLVMGLHRHGVESLIFCPRCEGLSRSDPLAAAGGSLRRFRSFLPVLGLSAAERRQQVAIGGNLMSLDLPVALWREPVVSLVHAHALGRLGGIASFVARRRGVPLVVTIHGGFLDLPEELKRAFQGPRRGWEWGKIFGLLLGSRRLFQRADAILTCNPREAALLHRRFPNRRVVVQPHGIALELFEPDQRASALETFPELRGREVLLCVGRIDPVKNQCWLVKAAPALFQRHPNARLVLAGACTDERYGQSLSARIRELGLENHVLLTGGLPPGDPRLVGLFQAARVVVLPSVSETFGLVVLEAWAAGSAVIASRTSGACALVEHGENGWLFELERPAEFHAAVDAALASQELRQRLAAAGKKLALNHSIEAVAGRVESLYAELIDARRAQHRRWRMQARASGG